MSMEAKAKIEENGPYHTFDLPGDVHIAGVWDHRPVVSHYELPVAGKTLLDAGCRDGFFSWLFEQQGADVTGLDIIDRPVRRMLNNKFDSKIKFMHMNILELAGLSPNQFDIVFCSDVLQHLESALAGLRALHHVCKETAYLVVDLHDDLGHNARVGTDPMLPQHWGSGYFMDLVSLAGFRNVKNLAKFKVSGPVYPTRNVGLFQADADPDFTIERLINGPLWASTCLCDLSKTHRVEADITYKK